MALSIDLLECPHNMVAGFLRVDDSRESKVVAAMSFMSSPWKTNTVMFTISYWLYRSSSLTVGGTYIKT